jgi:hypothetical protein
MDIEHLDGSDVLVIDARGRRIPAVDEVRVEADRAVVVLRPDALASLWASINEVSYADTWPCTIRSRDGRRLHWHGPVRVACA